MCKKAFRRDLYHDRIVYGKTRWIDKRGKKIKRDCEDVGTRAIELYASEPDAREERRRQRLTSERERLQGGLARYRRPSPDQRPPALESGGAQGARGAPGRHPRPARAPWRNDPRGRNAGRGPFAARSARGSPTGRRSSVVSRSSRGRCGWPAIPRNHRPRVIRHAAGRCSGVMVPPG